MEEIYIKNFLASIRWLTTKRDLRRFCGIQKYQVPKSCWFCPGRLGDGRTRTEEGGHISSLHEDEMQTKESMGATGAHRLRVLKKIARDSEPQWVWQVGRWLPEVQLELQQRRLLAVGVWSEALWPDCHKRVLQVRRPRPVVALKVQLAWCVRIAEVSTSEFSTTVLWLLSLMKRKKWIPKGKSLLSTAVSESSRAL